MATTTKKSNTTTKKDTKEVTTSQVKNSVETEVLQQELTALKAQNEMLMKMFMELKTANASTSEATQSSYRNTLNDTVTLVHLMERASGLTTHIALTNLTIDFVKFGEERTLDRRQAEELAGKYRGYFEKGIMAFGADGEDFARNFGLKSIKDYTYYSKDFVNNLGSLSLVELENLYNKVSIGHKDLIIQYFKRKIVEGDPAFKNIHKVEMLNRISDGAMSNVLLDFKAEAERAAKNK